MKSCTKSFMINVAEAPFSCGSTPININDVVFVQGALGGQPPLANLSMTAGSGVWDMIYNLTTQIENAVYIEGTICNPGDAYNLRFTADWNITGSVVGAVHLLYAKLIIDGVEVNDSRDIVTGPFTVFDIVNTVPAMQTSVIRIEMNFQCSPNPSIHATAPPGPFTIAVA